MQHNPLSRSLFLPTLMIIILLILLGGVVLLGYKIMGTMYQQQNDQQTPNTPKTDNTDTASKSAQGYIFVNLHNASSTDLYLYDVANNSVRTSPLHYITPVASADEKALYGTGMTNQNGAPASAIFVYQVGVQKDQLIYASSTISTPFSHLQVSKDGNKYTFEVPPQQVSIEDTTYYTPSNWRIYLGSTNTDRPRMVAKGAYAHFSPDGTEILYTADDGFHMYNIADETDTALHITGTSTVSIYFMSAVSHDGSLLATTDPIHGVIEVANITSWHPFSIANNRWMFMQGLYPTFSPDNSILALQQIDWDVASGNDATNPRLTFVNLETGATSTQTQFTHYSPNKVFMSDWIRGE